MGGRNKPKDPGGWIPVAGRNYAPEHIARIDEVVRRYHAGENQVASLVGAGFSGAYTELFKTKVYLERLRCWVARLEAEYLDQRGAVFLETLTLARSPDTPPHVRERCYRTLGKWCGLERGPMGLPGAEAGQSDTIPPDAPRDNTNEPVLVEFEVLRDEVESGQSS